MEKIAANNKDKSMIRIERAAYILVILFLAMSLIREAFIRTELELTNDDLITESEGLRSEILEDSSKIYSMKVNLADKDLLLEKQQKTIALLMLREPKEIVRWKTKTVIKDTITIAKPSYIDSELYLKLPQPIRKEAKWYSLHGNIKKNGVMEIDSLVSFVNFSYGVGDTMRTGFVNRILGRKDKVVRLHVDNPHVQIQGMDNIYLHERKKWYQTTLFKVGAGFILGAAVVTTATK
jgi:hypothetical protein